MRVLITFGATRESIDPVRYITNFSSGKTGAQLADYLSENHQVDCLHGIGAELPKKKIYKQSFESFNDLDQKIHQELRQNHYDAIIHLAAVSDYSVDQVFTNENKSMNRDQKINSNDNITIELKKNHKIISLLREYSVNKEILVFGFKLTTKARKEEEILAVNKLYQSSKANFIIHNDLSSIDQNKHLFSVYKKNQEVFNGTTKKQLYEFISKELK